MTSKIWEFPQLQKTLHDHQTAVEETAVSCCLIAIAKSLEITHFHVSLSESPCTGVSIALEESTTLGEIGEKIARSMDLSCAQKACIIMTITDDARNLSTSVWKVEIERYEGDGLYLRLTNMTQSSEFLELILQRAKEIYRQFCSDPSTKFTCYTIIGDWELEKIRGFASGTITQGDCMSFSGAFELQADQYPERKAVICGDSFITYRELNEKANQLARYIQQQVSGSQNLIGIFMERSIEFVIAILGIMKSGNAYVPIDPDTLNPGYTDKFPSRRLSFMMHDTEMPMVVTKQKFLPLLPFQCLKLSMDSDLLNAYGNENVSSVEPDMLAYGIYTSGSTGYPKLTLVKHESIWNLIQSLTKYMFIHLKPRQEQVLSVNAAFGFDASVQQLSGLTLGYTLCLFPESVRNSSHRMIHYIRDNHINAFDCTPSQLDLLLNDNLLCQCASCLDLILVGGEIIPEKMWNVLRKQTTTQIYNVYGPTECTVDSTFCHINGCPHEKPVIGRPIDNAEIHILDDALNPVPIGAIGEIYIAGKGVSVGYLNRNEMNSSHFFSDSRYLGGRLYKSGDWGTFLPDGSIYCIGRKDDQIKIRSHRIELSEIVNRLNHHESVQDSIAVVIRDGEYDTLVAYMRPRKGATIPLEQMADFLANYLPAYMIPNSFVIVNNWPLTNRGKIDRSKLPHPHSTRCATVVNTAVNDEETIIIDIMKRILGISTLGRDENFMLLGGDSLRVMTLLAEVMKKFHVEVDFQEFFRTPTATGLAAKIRKGENE